MSALIPDAMPIASTASDCSLTTDAGIGFSALGTFVVIAFLGLYLAIKPTEYVDGFVRLFRPGVRLRVEELLRVGAIRREGGDLVPAAGEAG